MGASVLVSVTKFSLRLDVLTFCTEFRTKCFYLTSSNLMISTFKNSLKDILSRNVSVDADFSVAIYYSRVKEVVVRRCPVKKMFLSISQNSQENACAEDPGTGVCLWVLLYFYLKPLVDASAFSWLIRWPLWRRWISWTSSEARKENRWFIG